MQSANAYPNRPALERTASRRRVTVGLTTCAIALLSFLAGVAVPRGPDLGKTRRADASTAADSSDTLEAFGEVPKESARDLERISHEVSKPQNDAR